MNDRYFESVLWRVMVWCYSTRASTTTLLTNMLLGPQKFPETSGLILHVLNCMEQNQYVLCISSCFCLYDAGCIVSLSSKSVWGWGSFSKVVVTFNHVGGSFNLFKYHHRGCLNNPIFLNFGLCAAC